jgi:hypothetical protein
VVLLWKERRRALLSLLRTTSSRPFFLALRSLNQKNALNPSLPSKLRAEANSLDRMDRMFPH